MRNIGIDPEFPDPKATRQPNSSVSSDDRVFDLSSDNYFSVLEAAGKKSGTNEIGILIGEQIDNEDLGLYGQIILNAPSIKDYLYMAARYYPVLLYSGVTRFHQSEGSSRIEYEAAKLSYLSSMYDVDMLLALHVQYIRRYCGKSWVPLSAGFEIEDVRISDERYRVFGRNILFSQSTNYIEVDSDTLETYTRNTNTNLLNVLQGFAEDLLEEVIKVDTTAGKVRHELVRRIGRGSISEDEVARTLNLSRATLQRRMTAEGTTYKKIRDDVIYKLSKTLLSETDTRISDIAFKMGYSEISAFDRAFRRLSGGLTPLQYRRKYGRK